MCLNSWSHSQRGACSRRCFDFWNFPCPLARAEKRAHWQTIKSKAGWFHARTRACAGTHASTRKQAPGYTHARSHTRSLARRQAYDYDYDYDHNDDDDDYNDGGDCYYYYYSQYNYNYDYDYYYHNYNKKLCKSQIAFFVSNFLSRPGCFSARRNVWKQINEFSSSVLLKTSQEIEDALLASVSVLFQCVAILCQR